jgi:hypothetical protein
MVQTRAQANRLRDVASLISVQHHDVVAVHQLFTTEEFLSALPLTIQRMFQIVAHPSQSTELTPNSQQQFVDKWRLMSLEQVIATHRLYSTTNPQCCSIDIAYLYHGMGHHVVCSVDKRTGNLYYRMDGGSDGHTFILNQRFAMYYEPLPEISFAVDKWIADIRTNVTAEALDNVVWS